MLLEKMSLSLLLLMIEMPLTFSEFMSPKVSANFNCKDYIINTPEEIEYATNEMIRKINGENIGEDSSNQKKFKNIANSNWELYGKNHLLSQTSISLLYLDKNKDLLV